MFKFYILLSNPGGFFRHFSPHYSNLSPEDAEVVINTQYEDAQRDLVHLCERFGVTYHITESNGTPARGKNELLKVFLNSDNKYMAQIDGDDYLTPYGVWLYKHIASLKSVPDAICIKNGVALCMVGKMFEEAKREVRRFFTIDWDEIDYEEMKNGMVKRVPDIIADQSVAYHKVYYKQQRKWCEDNDAHNRVTFFSQKAAGIASFDEDFIVGEDTLHYFALKHEHMQGNITFVCNDESPATYIYNQLDGQGTVWRTTKGFTDWSWMSAFNKKVAELEEEGKVYEKDLPLLKLSYSGYENFDDLNTSGLTRWSIDDKSVDLPANATQKCIKELILTMGQTIEK